MALSTLVAVAGWGVARWLHAMAPLAPDAVVLALLAGMAVHASYRIPSSLVPGIEYTGRRVLELAIVLLGITTDLGHVARAGLPLVAGVVAVTLAALGGGYLIAVRQGLGRRHAILVASGNAICGNSAIVAVGRVVGATAQETASSIAATALLSIGLVLVLPLLGTFLGLEPSTYGILAGMTVYAMPQVLAATFPVSPVSGEVGTMVKLVRVMFMVPWLMWLGRESGAERAGAGDALRRVLPGYLLLFLAGAVLRTAGVVPEGVVRVTQVAAHALTVVAMAGVGLSVDPGSLRQAGVATTRAALLSMLFLLGVAVVTVLLLGV